MDKSIVYDPIEAEMIHAVNLANGASQTISGDLTMDENIACPIYLNLVYDHACACDEKATYFDEIPPQFFTELPPSITLCPGEGTKFEICHGYDFALDPANGGTITNTGDSLEVQLNPDFGETSPVLLKITNTLSSCEQSFQTPIFQIDDSFMLEDKSATACQDGCTPLQVDLPAAWADDAQIAWSPTTFLDNPTSASPEVCDPTNGHYLHRYCYTSARL